MENNCSPDKTIPVQFVRGSRAFKQFKNPPQPHMCIQDTVKNTSEKLFINVLGWQKIANPKQYSDPIPLYGGMQVPQGCGPSSPKPPLIVFAVMVNPEILKANGKNAANPMDRDALVSLLCDFVEAMNPGLLLTRSPVILKDRDLAGELKDVWLAVQNKREREKGMNQDVLYKVYDIDGVGNDEITEDDKILSSRNYRDSYMNSESHHNAIDEDNDKKNKIKSSKQILINAGQRSEFDSGMNNYQLSQNLSARDNAFIPGNSVTPSTVSDTTICTPVYGQIVSTRENHMQVNDLHQNVPVVENIRPCNAFRKESNIEQGKPAPVSGWDEFSKRDISLIKNGDGDIRRHKSPNQDNTSRKLESVPNNVKESYNFFPLFESKTAALASTLPQDTVSNVTSTSKEVKSFVKSDVIDENSKIIIDTMQKLVLHSTDNKTCDSTTSGLSSISS